MTDWESAQFWASQPRFDPFTPAAAPIPKWCRESQDFADWCLHLVEHVAADPIPAKVAYAKVKLLDFYCRAHAKTTADHRAETNLDNHPCLHRVMLTAWNELENVELRRGIPELYPPPVPVQEHPIVQVAPRDPGEVYAEQVTGIVVGQDDDKA